MPQTNVTAGPTLDQRRAKHAWEAVKRAKQKIGPHADQDPRSSAVRPRSCRLASWRPVWGRHWRF